MKERILRYHTLKPQQSLQMLSDRGVDLDEKDENLMKMEIKITFNLQLLTFLNLIPDDNDPEELYTMEIKVGNKLSKKTELVKYEDF